MALDSPANMNNAQAKQASVWKNEKFCICLALCNAIWHQPRINFWLKESQTFSHFLPFPSERFHLHQLTTWLGIESFTFKLNTHQQRCNLLWKIKFPFESLHIVKNFEYSLFEFQNTYKLFKLLSWQETRKLDDEAFGVSSMTGENVYHRSSVSDVSLFVVNIMGQHLSSLRLLPAQPWPTKYIMRNRREAKRGSYQIWQKYEFHLMWMHESTAQTILDAKKVPVLGSNSVAQNKNLRGLPTK